MLFATQAAHADFSLGIYPPIMQIQANAPTAIRKDITVVNASDTVQHVNIIFRLFTSSPTSIGQVQYLPDSQKPSPDPAIFQKIQLLDGDTPITGIDLAPKQKKTLTLHIGLEKGEPAGDYYFSILFISNTSQGSLQNGSTITPGIGANVLLSIGPQDKTIGFLEEFASPWFLETGPVPFTVLLSNLSRHYINPQGHIVISNMFGQLIGEVNLQSVNVLSQTSRFIPSSNGSDITLSDHPVALWNEKFLFGPYKATLTISLGADGPIFSKTIYFFAMPVVYIIGLFIAIILVSIVVVRVKKRAQITS